MGINTIQNKHRESLQPHARTYARTHTHTLTHTGAEVAFLLLQLPQLPVLGTAVCGVVIAGATWAAQRAAMMKARLEQHRVRCKFEETIVACMKYAFVGTRCVWW